MLIKEYIEKYCAERGLSEQTSNEIIKDLATAVNGELGDLMDRPVTSLTLGDREGLNALIKRRIREHSVL
ncbi:hypothetical protein [Crocosphaera subtropica]|nr:hypothetical protein [Crocosphaera subtropica]